MEYRTILVEKRDEVDWVTLNRPEALNAITLDIGTAYRLFANG